MNGIDPEWENDISIINNHMVEGQLNDLKPGGFGVILGQILARKMGVSVGDKIVFVLPEASITPGGIYPRLKRLTVVGIFKVGAELDNGLAMTHINDAAILGKIKGRVNGLRLKLDDLFLAGMVANQLTETLSENYYATDWTRSHGNLFKAIQLEKNMIQLLLFLIVAVAAFNVVSTLIMLVTDKKADIAILRTLGASPIEIMGIFMTQGLVIGFFGIALGVTLGVVGALSVSNIIEFIESLRGQQFLNADVYFIDFIPSDLRLEDIMLITVSALVASFLSTLYPAWRSLTNSTS